jgi:methylmalonyl-CoA mutase cobalamin-binding subunit
MIFISAQDGIETFKVMILDNTQEFISKAMQVKTKAIVISSIKYQEA